LRYRSQVQGGSMGANDIAIRLSRQGSQLVVSKLGHTVPDKDRIDLGHGNRTRGTNLDSDGRTACVDVDPHAAAGVECSRRSAAGRTWQVEIGRERLAFSERDLEVAVLHGSTP
jgi:hypothetical protein